MNTKLIMTISAIILAAIGISLIFLPDEIAGFIGIGSSKTFQLILQLLGALFFAFAMLNWMAKGSIIGGIYNRPLTIANFTHFAIGGLGLIKALMNDHSLHYAVWILASIYTIFALLFGILFTRHPASDTSDK